MYTVTMGINNTCKITKKNYIHCNCLDTYNTNAIASKILLLMLS